MDWSVIAYIGMWAAPIYVMPLTAAVMIPIQKRRDRR